MSIKNFLSPMKEYKRLLMVGFLISLAALLSISGCSQVTIKDGGLVVGKDTTACIEDVGVASLNGKF